MEKILIIDDDKAYAETLKIVLSESFSDVDYVTLGSEGLNYVLSENPDVVITDLKMPEIDGLEVLRRIKEIDESIAVLIITAFENTNTIVEAMQLGAYDYIDKSFDLNRIQYVVKKAIESKKNIDQLVIKFTDKEGESKLKHYMIGDSPQMKEIFKKIGKVSGSRVNVLVQGESGTGKELVTRLIHNEGITRNDPFIAVNCSALSESLLESELFGHVQGAFTGAIKNKKGKFELAGKGTIFLDEISEISPNLQAKLLRVIQEREFERVGGEAIIKMEARIVAATNKDLLKLVEKGDFRKDLYYRLNIFAINIPPLRERKEEIPKFIVHFLKKINLELHKNVDTIPYDVVELLKEQDWVGNVRELENTLMNAVLLAKSNVLEKEHFSFLKVNSPEESSTKLKTIAEVEKVHIEEVLEELNWNKSRASRVLGITKTTLYNKIALYKLTPKNKKV
ncbi:MAG TPA: sigma-54 dependent transcriptional regulator [Ignavibacteriaceae bacterium]|nr:sigma-54 dependent transcriptional regulator [Ignavibacteriaceae bacterium]